MTWKDEPIRHSLASRGIPTSFGKLQKFHRSVEVEKDIPPKPNYETISKMYGVSDPPLDKVNSEVKNFIFSFWWASYHNNWKYFDLNEAMMSLKKLTKNYIMWDLDIDDSDEFQKLVNGKKSIKEICSKNKVYYDEYMEDMVKYYKEVRSNRTLDKEEKIQLIDKSIHISHSMGTLLGGDVLTIPKLRNEFEEEYL